MPTIFSSSISAVIAFIAFCVAFTQREIAKNKYNLDLFDKRYQVYKEYYDFLKTISATVKLNKDLWIKEVNCKEISELFNIFENIIMRINMLYKDKREEIISIYIEKMQSMTANELIKSSYIEAVDNIKNSNEPKDTFIFELMEMGEEELSRKIKVKDLLIIKSYNELLFELNNYNTFMVNSLRPPLEAYSVNLYSIIKNIIKLKI
ncbi:hypothetical protein ACTVH1_03650 [Gluconobacter cerinus]